MKKSLIILMLMLTVVAADAQRLVASAPSHVSTGEQFRITYTINTQNVSGFRAGSIPGALEVLMGPSTSSQSSFQMVNGHTSSSSSITYTYILCANKNGSFVVSPAHINAGGRTVSSNALRIKVSGRSRASSSAGGGSDDDSGESHMRAAGSRIKSSDLFIKVKASKTHVHEQEPVLLTYKVYTLVDLTQLEGKMPDLKGFHTQEVKLPQQKSFHIERVGGKNYRCVTWSQYVMYPQMTGSLQIPSIVFKGVVVQQNRSVDPFEAFFNGGSGYVEVRKAVTAPGVTIHVDPLPARPANFSGGVGHFNISAQLNKKDIRANDPVTLRVIVGGIGNLKLIKQPVVSFPKDFDKYDAKVTDKTKLTENGVEGNMIYDFLAVPRHKGKYTIPSVQFTYYDTSSNTYKTIKTQPFALNVSKGNGSGSVDDYSGGDELLNSDIRPLKKGDADIHNVNDFFFGSISYIAILSVLAVIFITLFVVFHKRVVDNGNIGKLRRKKASKVASRRLKIASNLMFQGKQKEFYDEVLKTLWGYIGDKLNIPVEQLTKDNISDKLQNKGISADSIVQFINAIKDCEYERFAPGDTSGNMEKIFSEAMDAIESVDNQIGKKKVSKKNTLTTVILILMLFFPVAGHAITKANADTAYIHENYQQAIKDYEELLHGGVSAELYYNMGNAYYRTDNITMAVLYYERALLLSPGDPDIRFNLQLARSKTIDKITPESEMFFITWYHSLVNLTSVDGWAKISILCFFISLFLALVYLFTTKIWLRKSGFYGGMAMLAFFIFSILFAYQQKEQLLNRTGAIIISPSVTIKSTPSKNSTDLFIIHEGTKVNITDNSMKGWKEVKIADGKQGWIPANQIEII